MIAPIPPAIKLHMETVLSCRRDAQIGLAHFLVCRTCGDSRWTHTDLTKAKGAIVDGWIGGDAGIGHVCATCEDFRRRYPDTHDFIVRAISFNNEITSQVVTMA